MPVAIIDSFKTLRLLPDDVSVVAEKTSDTLVLTAGIGINFNVNPLTDTVEIYNTGQGLAALDDILNIGNTSAKSVVLDRLIINPAQGLEISWVGGISGTLPSNVTVANGGVNYQLGDVVTINTGDNNATFRVVSVDNGVVTGLEQLAPGTGYDSSAINVASTANQARLVASTGFNLNLKVSGGGTVYIDGTSALRLPVGPESDRPDAVTGQVRFNTDTNQFEGYNSLAWTSLGGVRDVANSTYILPELTPGSDDKTLYFYANDKQIGTFNDIGLTINDGRVLAFSETTPNGTNTISIQAPDNVPADYTLTLPPSLGVYGSVLGLNSLGQLEFVVPDSFGGSAIYVSSARGDDSYDGVAKPVKTLKRALEIASGLVYSPSFVYNEEACKRDVGVIVDSLGYDLAYGSNWRSIMSGWSYYSNAANPAITTQKSQTLSALQYLKTKVVETQTGTPATIVSNLADIIYNVVNTGVSAAPAVSMPNPTSASIQEQNAKRLILANIVNGFIDAEITAWIQDKISTNVWPGFTYNAVTCARDIRYISYAVAYDIIYGGNSQSVYAGLKYYDALLDAETLQIPAGQKQYTLDSITKLKSVLRAVAQAIAVVPNMSGVVQDTSGSGGGATADAAVSSLVDIVLNILSNGPSAAPTVVNPTATKTYGTEQTLLAAKKTSIEYNVIAKTSDYRPNGTKIAINVAAGEYYEANPLIVPDNVSVIGASLRACNIRPLNPNKDFLRVRNASYFSEFTFRDALDANGTPVSTWNYAVSFDNPEDESTDRLGYVIMPNSKPVIDISPYIQNCSIISFLGGSGALVDGSLVVTPNVPRPQLLTENPVSGPAPEQGHSMVANAFTMLTFGGTAWRVINDAYIQIVSCFQIFAQNGTYCQSGGYASITNSATNFGNYALRASGYSPNAFAFDKGYVAATGTYNTLQSITALGFGREPTQDYVVRFRDPTYKYAYDLLLANKDSIVSLTNTWIDGQISSSTAPFIGYSYTGTNRTKGERDLKLVIDAVALDILTGGNSNSVAAGLSYQDTATDLVDIAIASIAHAKGLAQSALTSLTGKSSLAGLYFDIVTDAIFNPLEAPNAIPYGTASEITSNFIPTSTTVAFNAATDIDTSTNIFTINSHGFLNGDAVIYSVTSGTAIYGMFDEQTYYVNYIDPNTFSLSNDESLNSTVSVIAAGSGTHEFIKNLQEFYIKDLVSSHNSYQTLTLSAGTYSFTPGATITGSTGATTNNAYVYSYNPLTRELVVSLNEVTVGGNVIRNPFDVSSIIASDNGSPAVTNITITAVSSRSDLYSGVFTVTGTTTGAELTDLLNLPTKQIWLHRPSIVNSSGHTWEYAGSGTDYNALPQNGGKTRVAFEQFSDLPGRVYSSGTNELGDFKVGNFITAQNRTGNVSFTNKVSVNQLDALRLAVGNITIEYISDDIGLGDNESGGASNSRLSTQLAIRSFLANRLGNFIDKSVSTNAVPGAVIQLNSSGQINSDLLPAVRNFNSAKSNGYFSRLSLVEEIPAYDLLNGDIASEIYSTVQITLSANVTFPAGVVVTQDTSGATGYLVSEVTNSNVITVASYGNANGQLFNATFNTVNNLTINGDTTPSTANGTVKPTLVGSVATNVTNNFVLTNSSISQYLVLNPSGTYNFTVGAVVTGANDNKQATVASTRYGVINTLNVGSFTQGSGYSPASGSTIYSYVALTGGSGTGAIADITVTNGQITNVDLRRGGTGYVVGDSLSAAAASIGGTVTVPFAIPVTSIQKRLYINLLGGERFTATSVSPNFIADNNANVNTITLTGTIVKSFNAADVGAGGDVNTASSTITISGHSYSSGDPITYSAGVNLAIGGLTNGNVYYVKVINSSTIQLYKEYSLSTLMLFSSSSSGTHTLTIKAVNTGDETVYLAGHPYVTGDPIQITGSNLPVVDGVAITSGSFFFVGSITTNSFTLHTSRADALASVNGLATAPVNFTATGSGTATLTKQNVSVLGVVNTSSVNESAWSPLSTTNVDAANIISGTINTSRLANTGTANSTTYLRGDQTWHTAVQSIKESNTPITITGSYTTSGSDNLYYGDISLDIERVDSNGGDSYYTNLGAAKFLKAQFAVGTTGDTDTRGQVYIKDNVIDAGTLQSYNAAYFLNPANLTSPVPVNKGGTNLNSYSVGDMLYANGAASLTKLGIGSTNQVLTVNALGNAPQWSNSLNLPGDLTVNGNLTVNGSTTTVNTTTLDVDDKNIELGKVVPITGLTATIATGNNTITMSSTAGLIAGMTLTKTAGVGTFGASPYITSVDSATQITLNVSHSVSGAITFTANGYSDLTANSGGITLKGTTDKTIAWDNANANWTSSENWNLVNGKTYKINNVNVLSSTTLGSGVINSSLQTVGTITSGTWTGSVVAGQYGGTGVANTGKTITLGGNISTASAFSTAGAFSTTLTSTAATNVTLPTTGTLATLAGLETLTNKTLTSPAITGLYIKDSSIVFEGATDDTFETTISITDPTADRTITFPDTTGTVVTTGDVGTVTSTMIANGTIMNADINPSAAIDISKLAYSTISGVSLGNNLNTLTFGTYLTGNSYNGGAAVTIGTNATSANTVSTLVARDVNGNFSAGTITASLSGNATSANSATTATTASYLNSAQSAADKDDITTRTNSGFWQTSTATKAEGWPEDSNTWAHLLASTHSNGANYYSMQFAGSFYNSNSLYYRATNGSGTTAWNKVWHEGNDGASSGLDADLLDGQHGSYYQPASSAITTSNIGSQSVNYATSAGNADTVDSIHASSFVRLDVAGDWQLASSSNGSTSYSTATLELREASFGGNNTYTPPRLSFHWGGVVASQIGVESSGRISILNNPGTGYEDLVAKNVTVNALYPAAGAANGIRFPTDAYGGSGDSANIYLTNVSGEATRLYIEMTNDADDRIMLNATGGTSVSNTLYTTAISTGADTTSGSMQGYWSLTGASRLQATYADLAEKYVADNMYEPGTVIMFGGKHEVTLATIGTRRVAGIVSTNAAYVMNNECAGEFVVEIALQGRVPCKVRSKIRKGDMLIADTDGYATASEEPLLGQVIGKALEDFDGEDGIIEVVVGRL